MLSLPFPKRCVGISPSVRTFNLLLVLRNPCTATAVAFGLIWSRYNVGLRQRRYTYGVRRQCLRQRCQCRRKGTLKETFTKGLSLLQGTCVYKVRFSRSRHLKSMGELDFSSQKPRFAGEFDSSHNVHSSQALIPIHSQKRRPLLPLLAFHCENTVI